MIFVWKSLAQILTTTVDYEDYEKHLSMQSLFSVSVMANVLETDFQVLTFVSNFFSC